MPRCGEDSSLTGVWPPEDIPPEVWHVTTAYLRCERHGCLPRGGGLEDQDSWTMAAFDTLAAELATIRRAVADEQAWASKRG